MFWPYWTISRVGLFLVFWPIVYKPLWNTLYLDLSYMKIWFPPVLEAPKSTSSNFSPFILGFIPIVVQDEIQPKSEMILRPPVIKARLNVLLRLVLDFLFSFLFRVLGSGVMLHSTYALFLIHWSTWVLEFTFGVFVQLAWSFFSTHEDCVDDFQHLRLHLSCSIGDGSRCLC